MAVVYIRGAMLRKLAQRKASTFSNKPNGIAKSSQQSPRKKKVCKTMQKWFREEQLTAQFAQGECECSPRSPR